MKQLSSATAWVVMAIGCAASGANPNTASIDFDAISSPIIHRGDAAFAYRDPAAHYHDGVFRIFHTLHHRDPDGHYYVYMAVTKSTDLVHWSKPKTLTPRDLKLNFSSPGNIVRHGGKWVICLQTYPTPGDETFGTADARIWTMTSDDLDNWSQQQMIRVKGPDTPVKDMGRMIDPYLLRDKDNPDRWWCFYKQHGVSMSYSDDDMKTWTWHGRTDCGENVCVLVEKGRYLILHSPGNGIGFKESTDLETFKDVRHVTLGQTDWPWAQGRLTAAHVLDLRAEPRVGKYLMFFHGASKSGHAQHRAHGHASLALAWSDDLIDWQWGGTAKDPRK